MANVVFKKDLSNKDIIKFTTSISGEPWKKALSDARKELIKKVKVDGYRPGSEAHKKMAASMINENEVIFKALNKIANNEIVNLVKTDEFKEIEDKITEEPASFDILSSNSDKAEFSFSWKKLPEVKIGDYKSLKLNLPKAEVTDEEVKDSINKLLEKEAILVPKKSNEIQKGDLVTFDFTGFIDGKEMENGSSKNFELEIGSNQFIPGFEDKMIGLKKGEEKSIEVKFPKDYHAKEIANKDAKFDLVIHDIKVKQLPELDDEFVKSLNIEKVSNVKELEKHQKEFILKSKEAQVAQEARQELFKQIASITKLSYMDEYAVKKELNDMKREYEQMVSQFGMSIDEFFKRMGKDKKAFDEEMREQAEQNVIVKYAITEISEKENINCEKEDLDNYIKEVATAYGMPEDEIREKLNMQLDIFENIIVFEKTIKWLIKLYQK